MSINPNLPYKEWPSETRETGSPFSPNSLINLFFRPRKFFSANLSLGEMPNFLLVAWLAGILRASSQVDKNLMRAELGRPRGGWDTMGPILTESWLGFWCYALAGGILGGVFIWYIGGWWYRVRLGWAGAVDPDKRQARLVYIYSSLVETGPAFLLLLIQTIVFSNYAEAWDSAELWSLVILIFPFWACLVSYLGAIEVFSVSKAWGLVWFVILPWLLYLFTLGLVALVFAMFGPEL